MTRIAIHYLVLLFLLTLGRGQGEAMAPIDLELVAGNLVQPVFITHAGDGSGRIFVVEKQGRIKIFADNGVFADAFVDVSGKILTDGEQGLLSLAFPPGFSSKGYFYIYYTNLDGDNVVARYSVSVNPNIADAASEEIILTLPHPTYLNHNGGQLAFGPLDGYLYIGTGDGGGGGTNSQDGSSLLGKILRIDVESGPGADAAYKIPADNPFVGLQGYREEIWALGLRNPWRFSFDRVTGDVGQATYEEIDLQAAGSLGGANYGWNFLEGPACYSPPTGCVEPTGYVAPIHHYDHTVGRSVTGGYVYRGKAYPAMTGAYFFADFSTGKIWGLRRKGAGWSSQLLLDTSFLVATFGEDEAGELYVADYTNGLMYRMRSIAVLPPAYQLLLGD